MASLWWHSDSRHVSEALSGIGELRRVISHSLTQHGFADVRANDLEVAGGKSGCWVSIAHFAVTDRQYWEVVMSAGGDNQTTQQVRDEVVTMLRGLRFL